MHGFRRNNSSINELLSDSDHEHLYYLKKKISNIGPFSLFKNLILVIEFSSSLKNLYLYLNKYYLFNKKISLCNRSKNLLYSLRYRIL